MIKYLKKICSFVVFITFSLLLIACGNNKGRYYEYWFNLKSAFNSPNSVRIWVWEQPDKSIYNDLVRELDEILIDLDKKFNIQATRDVGVVTDLMRVNNNAGIAPVEVDQEVIEVIKIADGVSLETENILNDKAVYDITISPIWQMWNFVGKPSLPKAEDIQAALPLVSYREIVIDEDEQTVYLPKAGMGIDLGSIVKGYAADKLKKCILDHGITKAIVNVGRNILTVGSAFDPKTNKDLAFPVGIATPYLEFDHPDFRKLEIFGSLQVDDKTIVTSGTYDKNFYHEGIEYHHILDPRTGYPFTNGVVSVTVITDESILGDAYSTALFSLGLEKGMEFLETKEDMDAVWVVRENEFYNVYITSGLEDNFKFNEDVEELNFIFKGVYE